MPQRSALARVSLLLIAGSAACTGLPVVGPAFDATVDTDVSADAAPPEQDDALTLPDALGSDDAPISPTDARSMDAADATTLVDGPIEDGGGPCAPSAVIDLAGRAPGADGVLRVFGNNQRAPAATVIRTPVGCVRGASGPRDQGYQVVYRYVLRAASVLRASTANPGTPTTFDTVINVTTTCAADATALACNDDTSASDTRSTASTRAVLPAGTVVYVIVGGYNPPITGSLPFGNFELALQEVPPVPAGAACTSMDVCASGNHCVVAAGATSASCVADGTRDARCRSVGAACNDGLGCTVPTPNGEVSDDGLGYCRALASAGAACARTSAGPLCVDGAVCVQVAASTNRCVVEATEAEPNNTPSTAQGPVSASSAFRGAISPGADVDCFAVRVPSMGALVAETFGACRTRAADTVLRMYTPTGSLLATNDDGVDIGACSRIQQSYLIAGTYAVCVSSYARTGTMPAPIARYDLALGVY